MDDFNSICWARFFMDRFAVQHPEIIRTHGCWQCRGREEGTISLWIRARVSYLGNSRSNPLPRYLSSHSGHRSLDHLLGSDSRVPKNVFGAPLTNWSRPLRPFGEGKGLESGASFSIRATRCVRLPITD